MICGKDKSFMRKFFCIPMLALAALALRAAEPTESHRAAALEFLKAKGTPQFLERNCRAMLERQLAAAPEYAEHRAELEKFYYGAFGFDALKDELVAMYAREYTEAELRELTAFYLSPLGCKTVAVEEKLVPAFAALLERKVREKVSAAAAK